MTPKTPTVLDKRLVMPTREAAELRMATLLRPAKRGCKLAASWCGDGPMTGPFGIYVSAETLRRWNAGIDATKNDASLDDAAAMAMRLAYLRGEVKS